MFLKLLERPGCLWMLGLCLEIPGREAQFQFRLLQNAFLNNKGKSLSGWGSDSQIRESHGSLRSPNPILDSVHKQACHQHHPSEWQMS